MSLDYSNLKPAELDTELEGVKGGNSIESKEEVCSSGFSSTTSILPSPSPVDLSLTPYMEELDDPEDGEVPEYDGEAGWQEHLAELAWESLQNQPAPTEEELEVQPKATFRKEREERLKLFNAAQSRHAENIQRAKDFAVEFPLQAMQGSLADLAHTLLDGSEVPVEFGFMSAMSAFGLVASKKLKLQGDALKINPNLYTVLVAPTGGKKSTAVWKIVDFFKGHGLTDEPSDVEKALVFPKAGSGEGLLNLFRPTVLELNVQTGKFHRVQKVRTRVLLTPDEFQEVLHKCRVENSTLAPELTSFFDGTSAGNATKDKTVNVKDGHLAMVGCITTKLWDETWSQGSERSLGLLNRLFLVSSLPRPKVFNPPMPDKDKLAALHTRIGDQLIKAGEVGVSEHAIEIFKDFYLTVDETQEESTRIETIIVKKLALILAVTNDQTEITANVARMAVSLANYQLKVRRLLNPSEAQNIQAQAENKLRSYFERNKTNWFSAAVIADRTAMKKTVGMGIVSKAISSLLDANEIKADFTGKAPKFAWNPDSE